MLSLWCMRLQKEHEMSVHNNIISIPDHRRPGIISPAHTINVIQDGCVKSATGLCTILTNVW